MSETPPRKRTATEAMNLRPRGQQHGKSAAMTDALEARLAAVLELHTVSDIAPPLCRECLVRHPCPTVRAARGETPAPTPSGDSSP